MNVQRWGGLGAFAMVLLFLFTVVIGPDFLFPAMGLPRPSRTPADPATRLATIQHPANYIGDFAAILLFVSFVLAMVGLHDRLQTRTAGPFIARVHDPPTSPSSQECKPTPPPPRRLARKPCSTGLDPVEHPKRPRREPGP